MLRFVMEIAANSWLLTAAAGHEPSRLREDSY